MRIRPSWLLVSLAVAPATALAAGLPGSTSGSRAAAAAADPSRLLSARRMRPRPGATPRGTLVNSPALFGERVFANERDGFALANGNNAQYPAVTHDGGQTWRIDGPQFHVDAADGPEGVGYVGLTSARTFFAYGSSVVDVTTNGGRTWWETFMGELVMAVVPAARHGLVAYVQQSLSNERMNPAATWQYVSRDGGRHWRYSTALGGG